MFFFLLLSCCCHHFNQTWQALNNILWDHIKIVIYLVYKIFKKGKKYILRAKKERRSERVCYIYKTNNQIETVTEIEMNWNRNDNKYLHTQTLTYINTLTNPTNLTVYPLDLVKWLTPLNGFLWLLGLDGVEKNKAVNLTTVVFNLNKMIIIIIIISYTKTES